MAPWVALGAVVVGTLVLASGSHRSDPASPAARSHRLAAELRCPVCEGLSVADSPTPTARAMAEEIRRRVDEGQSDAEIRQAFVDRFGEWVLLQPPASGVGVLVWALPGAGMVLAAGGLALAFRRWRREGPVTPTDADRALVEQARARREIAR